MERGRVYYPGLDALRGVAVIMVILFHCFPFFRIGWIGVDLFFVLSGFLITTILLSSREEKNYFKNFYARRALRIFPAYFFLLLCFYVAAPFFFSEKGPRTVYEYYTANQLWFWSFTQNWLMMIKGLPPEPYLQHLWSLAIEEQFYLVWPALVYCCRSQRRLQQLCAGAFLLAPVVRLIILQQDADEQIVYYHTLARADGFAAGAYLAVLRFYGQSISNRAALWAYAGFATLCGGSLAAFGNVSHNNAVFATVGYSVTALFFAAVCSRALTLTPLFAGAGLLKKVGAVSYGAYLYHLPVLLVVYHYATPHVATAVPNGNGAAFILSLGALAVTAAVSVASFYCIEAPFLRMKKRFADAPDQNQNEDAKTGG